MNNVFPSQLVTDQPQTFHGAKAFVDGASFVDNGITSYSHDIPKTKKTTILSADVYTLRTVPVELIPAPGAGKYLDILDVVVFNTNASVPYDSTSLGTIYASNSYVFSSNSLVLSQVDPTIAGTFSNNNAQLSISVNQALNIKLTSPSDPTVGDGDIVIYVTYKIITL